MKFVLIVGGLAVAGAVVGYAQWFCPDGRCALTGSWWGGATLGGLLGFAVHEGFVVGRQPAARSTDPPPTPDNQDPSAER